MRCLSRAWLVIAVGALGCTPSGGKEVKAPSLSPTDAAAKAIELLDANKDGLLDSKELAAAPGLRAGLAGTDTNRDGKISQEEIAARLNAFATSGTAVMGFSCTVNLDDTPLDGATVTCIPEEFLGSGYKPATGTADPNGAVTFKAENYDVPGLPCGYFRVVISKKVDGQEIVPAKYNTATILGIEASPLGRGGDQAVFNLTSR